MRDIIRLKDVLNKIICKKNTEFKIENDSNLNWSFEKEFYNSKVINVVIFYWRYDKIAKYNKEYDKFEIICEDGNSSLDFEELSYIYKVIKGIKMFDNSKNNNKNLNNNDRLIINIDNDVEKSLYDLIDNDDFDDM